MPERGRARVAVLAGLALSWASGAGAAWVVNERGDCVREWTPASLARGPAAIVNAPLVPVRTAVGGVLLARNDPQPGRLRQVLLPPLLAIAGGVMGVAESVIWLGTGLVDTTTGGYFEVAPEEATRLGIAPLSPRFASDVARPPATDRCGRRPGS